MPSRIRLDTKISKCDGINQRGPRPSAVRLRCRTKCVNQIVQGILSRKRKDAKYLTAKK